MQRKSANQFYNDMGDLITFRPQGEFHLSDPELKEFVGDYRSGEVDGEFQIALEQGQLVLKNRNNPRMKLTPIGKDEFNADGSLVVVFRREAGKVSGLTASVPEARGIEFNRTN
jgi:hypothetical protein